MKTKNTEKRHFPRGPLQIPVCFTWHDVPRKGYLTNLSAGGCLLLAHFPFAVKADQPVEVSFKLKNIPDEMTLAGQVTRVEPFVYNPDYGSREPINYALGIRFFTLNEFQQQVIEAYTQRVLNNMKQD